MREFSLWDRIKTIFDTIFSSSFFITLLVIIILTIVILVINVKIKSKAPRYASIICYALLMILVFARYGNYAFSMNDSVVEKFFTAMYFPNLVVYLSMLLISLLLLAINFINPHYSKVTKICNIFCFIIIWFFSILILDVAKGENISFYEVEEVYSNETLMILLQASMCIFFVWVGILLMNLAVRKIAGKLDSKDKERNNIETNMYNFKSDDQIHEFSDEDFQNSYLNNVRQEKNDEIKDILRHKDINL